MILSNAARSGRVRNVRRVSAVLLAWLIVIGSATSVAQVCGDADGSGGFGGPDVFHLRDYLYNGGPAPVGPADVDDYSLRTARDATVMAWNLVVGFPALSCPPGNPKFAPGSDTAFQVVYDEVFPAGAGSMAMRLYLKTPDNLACVSLPLRVRVAGVAPAISSVTIDFPAPPMDISETVIGASGTFLVGGATYSPFSSVQPGVPRLATVNLTMSPSVSDRPIELTWTEFPPMESGSNVHYPMLVRNDFTGVEPVLLASCDAETDGDGVPDCLDKCAGFDDALDGDLDGVPDGCDICPGFDDLIDDDADGVPNGCDICADYDDNSDIDNDGTIDCLDACTDSDNDGSGNPGVVYNTCPDDNCPAIPNPGQEDADGDLVGDTCDNCRNTPNLSQVDADLDGLGDLCDNCPNTVNPTQGDADQDGIGNACDADAPQLQVLADLQLSGWGNDCWGYTAPDGTEYAIYGGGWNIVIVRTTPTIQYVTEFQHAVSTWRDMKTYKNYLYAVSEGTDELGGLLVADLSPLPATANLIGIIPIDGVSAKASHNMTIDTVTGYAFLEGQTGNRSIFVHNLANPAAPAYVGSFGTPTASGIHDIYAHNNLLYVAEGNSSAWSIWDVTNKLSPVMRVRIVSPTGGYMHNIWPTPDGDYCVTTEETTNRTVKIWDISDYGNVQLAAEYLAPSRLAHNAHVQGNILFISHYESGVVALDISDPANPLEMAIYDTEPFSENASYWGCWGVYPHTKNGMVYASNMDGRLFVFDFDGWIASECGIVLTGDVNVSSSINASDVIFLVNFVFKGGPLPVPCEASGDVNCSGTVNSADIIYLVNYVFKAGLPPCNACTLVPGTWSCP